MADLAVLQAALAGPAATLPASAPAAPWTPPAGVPVNVVPVINVGSGPGAEAPEAQSAVVPAAAPGPTDSAPPGGAPVVGPGTAPGGVPGAAPSAGGAMPITSAVINQLRAERGQPIQAFGHTWTGSLASKMAALQAGAAGAAPAPKAAAAAAGKSTGFLANVGAGIEQGVAGALGFIPDVAAGAWNAAMRGGQTYGPAGVDEMAGWGAGLTPTGLAPNQGTPAAAPPALGTIQNMPGGSRMWENAEGAITGLNPRDVVATNVPTELLRAAVAGGTAMLAPGGLLKLLPEAAAATPAGLAALRAILEGGASAPGVAAGAVGGAAGQGAADLAPPGWKGVAGIAGNLVGGGIAGAGTALATGAGRAAAAGVHGMVDMAGLSKQEPLVNPETGAPVLDEHGNPVAAPLRRMAAAGRGLAAAAGQSPADLAASLAGAPGGPVEGFTPTAGVATRNVGLMSAERRLRTAHGALFVAADAANQAAIRRAVRGLSPGDAGLAAGRFVHAMLDAEDAAMAAKVEAATSHAAGETAAIGGAPGGTTGQAEGKDVRDRLQDLAKPVHDAASRLQDMVDPTGTLGVPAGDVRATARTLRGDPVKNAPEEAARWRVDPESSQELSAAERRIYGAAVKFKANGLTPFRTLKNMLGQVSEAQRALERAGLRNSQEWNRLRVFGTSIKDAMAEGVAERVTEEAQAADHAAATAGAGAKGAGVAASGAPSILGRLGDAATRGLAPGAGDKVFLPSGRALDVEYGVVEGKNLITSHDQDMRPNPAFPAELQPRNRSSVASQQQVRRIAATLQPERLGRSPGLTEGAPMIGPDGVVESGNGRTLGILRAHAEGAERSAAYREFLRQEGYDTTGMEAPVLVRLRKTELTGPERVQVAREGNVSPAMTMTASERALSDAKALPDSVLDLWHGGDVRAAVNRPFVTGFARSVPEIGEEGGVLTNEGGVSLDGERRIENALLARGYGDVRLVEALADRGDESIGALGKGMQDAAGSMARLRSLIDREQVPQSVDIAPTLLDAARTVSRARGARISLADVVGQVDMLTGGIAEPTERLLKMIFGDDFKGRGSRVKVANLLDRYADLAQKENVGDRLFGAPLSVDELLTKAQNDTDKSARAAARTGSGSFGTPSSAGGAGDGVEAQRPEHDAAGEAPGAVGGAEFALQPESEAEAEPVTPLQFDPEGAERRRIADAAWAHYKGTYGEGPVGAVLRPGRTPEGFHLTDAEVGPSLFRAGPRGADAADALIRAAGGDVGKAASVIGDYPAFSLRRAAEKDGVLDPAKSAAWLKTHSAFLDKFPALRAKFESAASAGQAVQDAMRQAKLARQAAERSALGHYLGTDPQTAIERLFGAADPAGDAAELVGHMRRDPTALDGLRQNTAEWLLAKVEGTAKAGAEAEIGKGRLQNLLKNPKAVRALKVILGSDGFATLQAASDALDQAAMVREVTAIKGSPGTAADLAAAMRGKPKSLVSQLLMGELFGEGAGHLAAAAVGPHGVFLAAGVRVASVIGAVVRRAAQQSGFDNTQELMAYGIAHPAVGRLLAERAAASAKAPVVGALLRRLGAIGIVGAEQANERANREGR